ncbi:MAG: hypothetical protein QE271_14025 [Bacteriovoracaceae bacterium]|nr:hypothetical protein [Bacteriovoracaceae bacterium]
MNLTNFSKHFFTSELSRFKLKNGLALAGTYYAIISVVVYYQWILLKINVTYFESIYGKQFPGFPEAFYDFLIGDSSILLMIVFAIGIVIFFAGGIISELLILPFKRLATFCENSLETPSLEFEYKSFVDFQFLSRFSEFFFGNISQARTKKKILDNEYIPKSFSKMHSPPLDLNFFLQFTLMMIFILGISSYIMVLFNSTLFNSVIEFVMTYKDLKDVSAVNFIIKQEEVFHGIIYPLIFVSIAGNFIISVFMYSRISGAAFGVFSTFRSFIKGNRKARVHLLGYSFVRDQTKKINYYLEKMEVELEQSESSRETPPPKLS